MCVCDSLLFSGKSIFYTNRKCLLTPRSAVLIRPLIPPISFFQFPHHSSFFHHSSVYPEYLARVQSVIPSMTSSQSEHRRSHSLSGWFSHPVWRNTSKKGKRKKEKEIPSSSFFCKCCFKPSLYLLCLWLMWALVCIFNHFSCLMVDCPHLLILSFYSTSSLLYVSLSSSGLRCIIIKLTTDSFLRTRSHFIYVCSLLQG